MKVLGVVAWKTIDKIGNPIAGVKPVFEILKNDWRAIDASEEFPTQGQAFWPNATAAEKALVYFRAEANPVRKTNSE